MNTTSASARKPGYFDFKRLIREASIKRQLKVVLIALMGLCPAGELTTERFPVTIEKVMTETDYSRSYVIRLIGELEDLGYVEKRRSIYRDAQGRVRNRPNVYTLRIPDAPINASIKQAAPIDPPPAPEPVIAHEEDLAAYEAYQRELESFDASWNEEPEPMPVEPQTPPAPESTPAPEAAPPFVAQSPDGFTEEEQELGEAIVSRAREKLLPHAMAPRSRSQVEIAWSTLIAARYSIGRHAVEACTEHKIKEKEILACVDEWVAKCVLRFDGLTRQQLALRLRRFFHDKGRAIVGIRNSEKFGLKMLA